MARNDDGARLHHFYAQAVVAAGRRAAAAGPEGVLAAGATEELRDVITRWLEDIDDPRDAIALTAIYAGFAFDVLARKLEADPEIEADLFEFPY